MKCKQVREMIMTDYMDGEISAGSLFEVESHLAVCASCRAAADDLQRAVRPFFREDVRRTPPPEGVWRSIVRGVQEDRASRALPGDIRIWQLSFSRWAARLAPLMAGVLVFALIWNVPRKPFQRGNNVVNQYLGEQINFLASMYLEENPLFYWQEFYLDTSLEVFMM